MKTKAYYFMLVIFMMISCDNQKPIEYSLSGVAQKGPFIKGSEVEIIELDKDLKPTGRIFKSYIETDAGFFSFPDVELSSDFIEVEVYGSYFNEIYGEIHSFEEITLRSIADISISSTINVNLITHFINARIKVLIQDGSDYYKAKEQALNELYEIFKMTGHFDTEPGGLDLTSPENDGGILLAISAIIINDIGSGMSFQEFLTGLTTDFKDNGRIDEGFNQKILGTAAIALNINTVRENLIQRYAEIGTIIDPYVANSFIRNFIENNNYPTFFDGFFPDNANGATNMIGIGDSLIIDHSKDYVIAIKGMTDKGISNIALKLTSTSTNYSTSGCTWYDEQDYMITPIPFNNNITIIPFLFTDSGSLTFELAVVFNPGGMVRCYHRTVIWN